LGHNWAGKGAGRKNPGRKKPGHLTGGADPGEEGVQKKLKKKL